MLCCWQEEDKVRLAAMTGLDPKQINNWFINQRKRHWKPSEDMRFALMEGVAGGSSGTTLYFDTGTIGPWTGLHFLGRKLASSSVAWPGLWRSSICRVKIDNKYLPSWNCQISPLPHYFARSCVYGVVVMKQNVCTSKFGRPAKAFY